MQHETPVLLVQMAVHQSRALYAQLRANRDRVRNLPLATPPADLRAKIIARIASATPAPTTRVAAPQPQSKDASSCTMT